MVEDLRKRKKNAKIQLKKAVEESKQAENDRKAVKKQVKNRRSRAYKHNVEVYGKKKANKIARMITKKRRGTYKYNEEDFERTRLWLGFVNDPYESNQTS